MKHCILSDLGKNSSGCTQIRYNLGPVSRKSQKLFRTHQVIFSSSVSKDEEGYTPETSCMKRTSFHIKNLWIKLLCDHKAGNFAMAFRARNVSGAFEKRAPGLINVQDLTIIHHIFSSHMITLFRSRVTLQDKSLLSAFYVTNKNWELSGIELTCTN